MKLRVKLVVLMVSILTVSFGICGIFSLHQMRYYTEMVSAQSQEETLQSLGKALREVGTREELDAMGETAREAYLKYQFQRCFPSGYALLKREICLLNLTDYEITAPLELTKPYQIQELGGKHLLLMKQALEYPEGYEVMAVKDISGAWALADRQLLLIGGMFFLITVAAATVMACFTGRLLAALEELRHASAAISRGEWGQKVTVKSEDELGQVSMAFNQMSAQVEQKIDDLQLLLGALAHEMKTPVTAVMGYADSLLHVRLTQEQQKRSLDCIYEAGSRMEQMASKLLCLVGMYENGAVEYKKLSVIRVLEQAKDQTREAWQNKRLHITVECPAEAIFLGDETLLVSLFSNLIQNSCKASQPDSQITVFVNDHTIAVRDHGCGISDKDLPHITNAFFMADKSRSRKEGGSGLGLALGLRIVKAHDGTLEITSVIGEGTCAAVHFPNTLFTKGLHSDEYFV